MGDGPAMVFWAAGRRRKEEKKEEMGRAESEGEREKGFPFLKKDSNTFNLNSNTRIRI